MEVVDPSLVRWQADGGGDDCGSGNGGSWSDDGGGTNHERKMDNRGGRKR